MVLSDAELEKIAEEIRRNGPVAWSVKGQDGLLIDDVILRTLRTVRDSVQLPSESVCGLEFAACLVKCDENIILGFRYFYNWLRSRLTTSQLPAATNDSSSAQLPSDFNKIHDAYIEKGHQSNLYKAELKHFYNWLRAQIKTVQPISDEFVWVFVLNNGMPHAVEKCTFKPTIYPQGANGEWVQFNKAEARILGGTK